MLACLTHLHLDHTSVEQIEGWQHFPHLEVLKIEKMPFFKTVNFQHFKYLKRLERASTTLEISEEDSKLLQKLLSQG